MHQHKFGHDKFDNFLLLRLEKVFKWTFVPMHTDKLLFAKEMSFGDSLLYIEPRNSVWQDRAQPNIIVLHIFQ